MAWLLLVPTILLLAVFGYRYARRAGDAPATVPVATDAHATEVDDELRGIFLAEARTEIGNLRRGLPRWRLQPDDLERAVPLRRAFHTLKGSGRLVGATALGDFSAKLEQVLLRVIDGTLAPRPDAVDIITRAVALLPGLVGEFSGERSAGLNVAAVAQAAERIVAGQAGAGAERRIAR
jgi:chemosensory pili system protein ChpA (sensor histidine kinase/response regulator)